MLTLIKTMERFKMLGIICAMEKEMQNLKKEIDVKNVEIISGTEFIIGKIKNKDCILAVCGIGKVAAAICAQTMIIKFKADLIINIGVAGALDKNIDVCSIVVAEDLVQYDMDTSAVGDKKGLISGINKVSIKADEEINKKIIKVIKKIGNINYRVGRILTGDTFIADETKKNELVKMFGGLACEMEGAAIAQTCYLNKTKFAIIRAISDNANSNAEISYEKFLSIAVKSTHNIILQLIEEMS